MQTYTNGPYLGDSPNDMDLVEIASTTARGRAAIVEDLKPILWKMDLGEFFHQLAGETVYSQEQMAQDEFLAFRWDRPQNQALLVDIVRRNIGQQRISLIDGEACDCAPRPTFRNTIKYMKQLRKHLAFYGE